MAQPWRQQAGPWIVFPMTKEAPTHPGSVPISEVCSAEALSALGEKIIASGELGRSQYYKALLQFLIRCAGEGRAPKEIELAIEALGKSGDFDPASDSSVRVYVHQLRKKLESYYANHAPQADWRLTISRGSYELVAERSQPSVTAEKSLAGHHAGRGNRAREYATPLLLVLMCLLLAANLYVELDGQAEPGLVESAAAHPVWQNMLADETPILLVMGDYYIFGELNANGNVARMVREFNVNSSEDLEDLRFSDIENTENYLDLDLSYMPEGSAFALARIAPILQRGGKPVNITMMSDLTLADVRSNHIVYVGYISALDKLHDMAFAGSNLQVGRSYDELFNEETAEIYSSDAGLPEEGAAFKDYGFFSTFPASTNTQVMLIAGMRDAGLMHTAQALSDQEDLNALIAAIPHDTDEAVAGFEVLFEVYGIDRMNFDAELVYSDLLDTSKIWQPESVFSQANQGN